MKKIVIIHNLLNPHNIPLLSHLVKDKNIDLEVFYLTSSAKNRRWKMNLPILDFKYKVLPNFQINFFRNDYFSYIVNPTIFYELLKAKYDIVIIDGWLDFACQAAFILSFLLKKKFILWSESTENEPSLRRTVAMPLVKAMVGHAAACMARSNKAKDYLVFLGANPKKIFIAPCVIDIDFFHHQSKLLPPEEKKLKSRLKIRSDSIVILYSGQLIKRKGLIYLLKAFRQIEEKYKNRVTLLIQGYGPEKQNLLDLCSDQKIKNVVFSDHVEVEEIPKIYGLANIFVLPSYEETWGRVINEAMACNLPIITTQKVGASEDLVKEGVNGFIVQEENIFALQTAIETLLTDEDLREKMGRSSWEISQKFFTPAIAAKAVLEAIEFVK